MSVRVCCGLVGIGSKILHSARVIESRAVKNVVHVLHDAHALATHKHRHMHTRSRVFTHSPMLITRKLLYTQDDDAPYTEGNIAPHPNRV